MVQVTFQPYGLRVEINKWDTVLEAAQKSKLDIRNVCGGKGKCGKCKIIISKGKTSTLSDDYKRFFTKHEIDHGYHLACQTIVEKDVEVEIPLESRTEGQKILSWMNIPKVKLQPIIEKVYFNPPIQKDKQKLNDLNKIQRYILKKTFYDSSYLYDPLILKLRELLEKDVGLTVTVKSGYEKVEVVDFEIGDTTSRNYGLAVDIGTTKVVAYLIDLTNGNIVDNESEYNSQLIYGEDLLSRIDYAYRYKEGLSILQRAVIDTLHYLLRELVQRNKVREKDVTDVCVAGNTVMTYLFVGENPSNLVDSEVEVDRSPFKIPSEKLGIKVNPKTSVYCLPSVSRFLGGDAVGDVLASRMTESPDISLLVDMGTNGEIVIGSEGWLLSTSCAAGPAFEGWEIKFGMRSVEGAIEKVEIDKNTHKATYSVIGGYGKKPRGICGSGLIDAISEMFTTGVLDNLGKIRGDQDSSYIKRENEFFEYIIVPKDENELGKDIVITQRDVDNLLDSKAAACGAISVLMKKVGVTIYDIKNLFLAGAFGMYINPHSATTIGIFPELPNANTIQLGNGSIAGAYMTLLSRDLRSKAELISQTMTYYDLTTDLQFMEEYSAALYIPGKKELFPSRI